MRAGAARATASSERSHGPVISPDAVRTNNPKAMSQTKARDLRVYRMERHSGNPKRRGTKPRGETPLHPKVTVRTVVVRCLSSRHGYFWTASHTSLVRVQVVLRSRMPESRMGVCAPQDTVPGP